MCLPTVSADLPLTALPGIGPKRAQNFAVAFGVTDIASLLALLPRKYQQPARLRAIAEIEDGQRVQVEGEIEKVWLFRPRGRKTVLGIRISDASGELQGLFFHQPYLRNRFEVGTTVRLEGTASLKRGRQLLAPRRVNPDEILNPGALEAIYADADGISAGQVAKAMHAAFQLSGVPAALTAWQEILPPEILKVAAVPTLPQAIQELHHPSSAAAVEAARRRLALGEVLKLEKARHLASRHAADKGELGKDGFKSIQADPRLSDDVIWQRILARVPFQLTPDQQTVLAEIRADLATGAPLSRLLHGEVGSGKTVIAFALALVVAATGQQVAILAPTEILARQHVQTFANWLQGAQLQPRCLLGDDSPQSRRACLSDLATGTARLVIGTHALFQKQVRFKNLGLVVFDEQHRFGVRQKAALVAKGIRPHVLTMTATPIPRTLAWAQYGALKPCVLRTRAGNQAEVQTRVQPPQKWPELAAELANFMRRGQRVFLVAPRIDGDGGLLSLQRELQAGAWSGLPMASVHGRMPGAQVQATVEAFKSGRILALLGTSVVEVGLDVAGIQRMVVLGAERFGVASLHQLRGRLARGKNAQAAICDLIAEPGSIPRLECLVECADGFQVAELDLKQRGPGTLRGVAQHGHQRFQVFDPQRDVGMLDLLQLKEIRNWLAAGD
ncbi:MAG: DEAD/DEAH box helicase [Planctomycetes bacterium]|nr:DEAD/DEAH box helicase [Planctomycetota bacterium]